MNELLAPNGKPSNLTPEQYKLVRTPAFKEWFGDWENSPETSSKVVDENGEPLVMYSGSPRQFTIFESDEILVDKDDKEFKPRFWFTIDKEYADSMASKTFGTPTIYICFLNIRNPKYDNFNLYVDEFYDGSIQYNRKNINVVTAINSNQIKLADGTNTTFDSSNPDIRYTGGGIVNDFDKIKFLISISNIGLVDYEYNIQYHSLYGELKTINNELGNWDSPKFTNEIDKLIKNRFFKEIKKRIILVDGKIRLFRALSLRTINDLKTDSLGIYWAYNYDGASVYDDEDYQHTELNKGNYEEYIIQADFNISDIDWGNTLMLYIINEFNEAEIRVKKNSVAHNLKIQKKGDIEWKFIDEKLGSKKIFKAENGGSVLLAPNGKPSNLTPEQYKLVRTPEFKAWFGDWENSPETASKIVDENGEPLIKYRGDNNPKNVFDYINYGGHGVYYFGDKNFAESFGDKLNSYFINSRNPFIPNKLTKKEENEIRNLLKKDANEILTERIQDLGFNNLYDYFDNYYLIEAGFSENSNSLDIIVWQLKNGINYFILELRPIIEWLKNNDYDGYESYEGNNDNIAVFNSNQIKLADGTNTTFDGNNPDIRFKKGGEIKDLIVLHNINEYQIKEANKLGGLVTPSIAIIKSGNSFTDFGSITLVGTKELIDPEKRDVKVFAGDVYSPSVPRKLYYVDKRLLEKITNELIKKAYQYDDTISKSDREIYHLVYYAIGSHTNFEEDINRMSFNELLDYYNDKLKIVYIVDKSIKIKVPMKPKRTFLWNNVEFTLTDEQIKRFAPILREYTKQSNDNSDGVSKEIKSQVYDLFLEVLENIKQKIKQEYYGKGEQGDILYKIMMDDIDKSFEKYVGTRYDWSGHTEYKLSKAVWGEKELDKEKLNQNIKKVFTKNVNEDYKEWLSDFISQFQGSSYFLKGNEKMPYTLDNLVDATSNKIVGQEKNMTFGVNQAKSFGTKRLNSIDEIKKNSDKIITKEEMNLIDEKNKDKFFKLSESLNYEYSDTWGKLDSLGKALADYFKGTSIVSALRKNEFKSPSSYQITLFEDFANELKNSPVDYFEAKYQRAVSLKEFKYAVVPKNTSKEIIEILNQNGLVVKKYETDEERLQIINNISEKDKSIKFKEGGDIEDDDYYYDESDIFWTNEYLVHYLFSQMNQFKHLEEKNLILSNDEKIVFREYNNEGRISMKPLGLWYAKGFEWVNWVQFEMPSWSSNYHYLHEIKTTDKVLKINNQEDAIKFSVEYGVYEQNSFDITEYTRIDQIDWHKVAKKWSGIEMVNPRANFEYITDRRLLWTGSWDIASGCIWKADGFSEINLLIDYKDYNNPDIRFAGGGQSGGDCYYVAGQFVIGNVFMPKKIDFKGTPYLVQAEVQGQGKVSHLRYGHAWIEDDEYVYDFSNNRELIIPKIVYYAIGDIKTDNPKKYRKYTFNEARRKMVDTGHYGCWDIDVEYENGGDVKYENQPRDLTQIENYRNIYKGAEFYTFSESSEKQEKADRWFELFRTNQKERQLTTNEFKEFMELSNELSWEEFANGGDSNWDAERYRQVEKEMYELRNQKKGDSDEYFKLIEERAILEKNKLKKINIKNMEYGKGGKVNMLPADTQKFGRIGVTDKYIIEATKDVGLQGINFDSNSILKRISATFDSMLENYKSYLISKDSPSITNYINNEIETHKEQGSPLETIQRLEQKINNQNERNDLIKDIAKTQEETLIQWVKYLNESEYPVPFKFLMLKAVFEYNYDVKQNKLFERGEETIRNFTPFDAGTLAELYAKQSDYLLMEYNVILNENANKIFNSKEIISQSGNGKWIKFNGGRKTKSEDIEKNGKELMQLVQNTYWCTKSAGTSQLRGGDFYVYVTESNGEVYPRIAVRMNENEVGEVRGNRSSAQDLDEEMLPIAEDFLIKNIPNNSGKKWLDSIKYNRRCVALKNRFETEGLFKDSLYDYMELIAGEINLNHGNNSNLITLKEAFKKAIDRLPNEYYKKGEIEDDYNFLSPNTRYFIGDLGRSELRTYRERYNVELTDLSNWNLQLVSGFVMLQDTGVTNLGNIEFVGRTLTLSPTTTDLGRLNYVGEELQFNGSPINSLKNLESIGGGLVVTSKIKDLGKLKKIGFLKIESSDDNFTLGSLEHIEGDLEILNSSVDIDFGNLKTIGGSLIAKNSQTQDLKNLESVGGDFIIAGSKIKKFENLKSIGGNADFSNNFCSSTQNINTILGDIKFLNSRIMQFPNLIRIGGTIEFRGSLFTSFGNIKNIGGNLNLAESKLLDLGELEAVGGYISFKGSKVKSLGKLKKVTQFAHFELSEVEDLGNLEIIGGNAYFQNSKVKSLGKLNYIGGSVIQFGNNKQLQEQWEKIKNG